MRITGIGVTTQSDWRCDATQPVEFDLMADGSISTFSKCILADGNVVDGISLPKGTSCGPPPAMFTPMALSIPTDGFSIYRLGRPFTSMISIFQR